MSQSDIQNAIVLVIDRLGASMLGAYGNTCFETENFNRLAARSFLFDHAITRTTNLEQAYSTLWKQDERVLMDQIGKCGASSVLLSDDTRLEKMALANSFDRVIPVVIPEATRIAKSVDETELASFFAQATQWMTEMEPGSLGWLHSRGLSGAWDAPIQLRERLADPEDPDPPAFYLPPAAQFDRDQDDPDELLGYQQVCAAQMSLIDDFFGVMLDLMEQPGSPPTLFCLMSTRGYPLGEHGVVGESSAAIGSSALYNESVHVPLMICLPTNNKKRISQAGRIGNLVQPSLMFDFLVDWFSGSKSMEPNEPESVEAFDRRWERHSLSLPDKTKEVVFMSDLCGEAIQTHAWKLIRDGKQHRLFAKPDDRWEVNDVSRRCPHVVEELSGLLDLWIASGEPGSMEDLELPHHLSIRSDQTQ